MVESRKSSREQDRQARAEERARKQRAEDRRRALLRYGVPLVVVLLVVGGIVFAVNHKGSSAPTSSDQVLPAEVTGETTVEKPVAIVPDTSGITGVVAYDTKGYPAPGTPDAGTLPHNHVPGPVTYSVTPPVGGDHNQIWMACGIYTDPVPSERAVHNLEHGAVWITYRPSLSAADVKTLTDFVLAQKPPAGSTNRYLDLTPWASDDLPSPIVISAWGRQLKVDKPDDPRLLQFIEAFRAKQGISPELGSSCDATRVDLQGRPAIS